MSRTRARFAPSSSPRPRARRRYLPHRRPVEHRRDRGDRRLTALPRSRPLRNRRVRSVTGKSGSSRFRRVFSVSGRLGVVVEKPGRTIFVRHRKGVLRQDGPASETRRKTCSHSTATTPRASSVIDAPETRTICIQKTRARVYSERIPNDRPEPDDGFQCN